ncbi:glutamine amidotransferase [Acinetobacter gerneri]|uniref:glutamine amidotransferase n=1 Tax=Acinetobacter gerneri TaxID=202952 RepID=UPI003A83902F
MFDPEILLSKKIYLIQLGSPPQDIRESQGDISEWFYAALKDYINHIEVIRVFAGDTLPKPNSHSVAILTGSWSMVTDNEPWSEKTAEWIRNAVLLHMPLFGICYGHQLIAHALGGRVDYHPKGIEIGCKNIELSALAKHDPLLKGLPMHFPAYLTHRQTIIQLPAEALVFGSSVHDPHQIVRYNPTTISTQFHPEFTFRIAETMIVLRQTQLYKEGLNINSLCKSLKHSTPEASKILANFVEVHFFKENLIEE